VNLEQRARVDEGSVSPTGRLPRMELDPPTTTAVVAAFATAFGALLGAIGATSLYLTGRAERRSQGILDSSPGERRHSMVEEALNGRRRRQRLAEVLTLIGVSLAVVGAFFTACDMWSSWSDALK
jgi:hypothetical protein